MYKVLFDMKNDINDLKKLTLEIINDGKSDLIQKKNQNLIDKIYGEDDLSEKMNTLLTVPHKKQENVKDSQVNKELNNFDYADSIIEEEPISLQEKEIEMIKSALDRSKGKRKIAAKELGISERTLYRKIKQFDLKIEDEK